MYHEGAVLDALAQTPRWTVTYWADRASDSDSGTLLSLWSAGQRYVVVVDDDFVTHAGRHYPRPQLSALLKEVQRDVDRELLADAATAAIRDQLLRAWQQHRAGTWAFPRGASLRWQREGDLLLEVDEGGHPDHPMPADLVRILVDLGWNPPTEQGRCCWLRPTVDQEPAAASLAVLTPMAAFGCTTVPPLADQAAPEVL